jgi:hypothetical protein
MFLLSGEPVPVRSTYKYLWLEIRDDLDAEYTADDMLRRAQTAFDKHRHVLVDVNLPLLDRFRLFKLQVMSKLYFGAEFWCLWSPPSVWTHVNAFWKTCMVDMVGGYANTVSVDALALEFEDLPPLWVILKQSLHHYRRWEVGWGGEHAQRLTAGAYPSRTWTGLLALALHLGGTELKRFLTSGLYQIHLHKDNPANRDMAAVPDLKRLLRIFYEHTCSRSTSASTQHVFRRRYEVYKGTYTLPDVRTDRDCNAQPTSAAATQALLASISRPGLRRLLTARLRNYDPRAELRHCTLCKCDCGTTTALDHQLTDCPHTAAARALFLGTVSKLTNDRFRRPPEPRDRCLWEPPRLSIWPSLPPTDQVEFFLDKRRWYPYLREPEVVTPPTRARPGHPIHGTGYVPQVVDAQLQFFADLSRLRRAARASPPA